MKIISHNYQRKEVQKISDLVAGTSDMYRYARDFPPPSVLLCGVLYMAEDFYVISNGKTGVYLPEIAIRDDVVIEPRCPMELDVSVEDLDRAAPYRPDSVLVYINMSAPLKALSDGVYNGTEALRIIDEQKSVDTLALIGDRNVNFWIQEVARHKYPRLNIVPLTPNVFCPPHSNIDAPAFLSLWNELLQKEGQDAVGMALHSEVGMQLLEFGVRQGIYIGGTTGTFELLSESDKRYWLVATIEEFVQRLRDLTGKEIHSPGISCPHMLCTTREKVVRARKILEERGPVADIVLSHEKEPCYEINIHHPDMVHAAGRIVRIPAVRLSIKSDLAARARQNLSRLVG
jgi:quinolinate synthase